MHYMFLSPRIWGIKVAKKQEYCIVIFSEGGTFTAHPPKYLNWYSHCSLKLSSYSFTKGIWSCKCSKLEDLGNLGKCATSSGAQTIGINGPLVILKGKSI